MTTIKYKNNLNFEYITYNLTIKHSLHTNNILSSPTNINHKIANSYLCSNNNKPILRPNIILSSTNINLIKIVLSKLKKIFKKVKIKLKKINKYFIKNKVNKNYE